MTLAQAFQGVLTRNQPIPDGIDGGRLALVQLKGFMTYGDLRAQAGAGAQAFNEEMVTAYGDMFYPTTNIMVQYQNGGTLPEMEESTEESRPQLIKGNVIGHMIDRKVYKYGIGGGWRAMEDADPEYILATIKSGNQMTRNRWEKNILTRFFTTTENTLGTTGADVPFCNGSPNALKYAPPQWGGQTFQDTHNHYLGFATASNTFADVFNELARTIAEHGVTGIYKAIVSETDVATIVNLTNFTRLVQLTGVQLDRAGLTSGATFYREGNLGPTLAMGGRLIGSYQSDHGEIDVYATYRLPQSYVGMYRPGPQGDPENALAINYRASFGLGVKILEKPDFNSTFPLAEVHLELEFGVSCGKNRFAGAAGYLVSGGVWVNPTIN